MADKLVSVTEAAAILGVDRKIVYREMERQRLTPAAVTTRGKQHRSFFHRSDVETLAAKRTEEAKV